MTPDGSTTPGAAPSPRADQPRVAIVYGSPTEADVMMQVGAMLTRFGVSYEQSEISPYRSPRALQDWVGELEPRGVEVVIAGGGLNASIAGTIAAHVTVPVIGVPLTGGAIGGLEALLSMTAMPAGVPVAVVGLGHATNAAVLAVQILAVGDPTLRARLVSFKDEFERAAVT
jgi:5-(carboxyamino)imidazole ribonucleotide mutase